MAVNKKLATAFVLAASLEGCATLSEGQKIGENCIKRNEDVNILYSSRKDDFDQNCALAQAAADIAKISDPAMQAVALQIYRETNPTVAKYLDDELAKRGQLTTTELADDLVRKATGKPVCKATPSGAFACK